MKNDPVPVAGSVECGRDPGVSPIRQLETQRKEQLLSDASSGLGVPKIQALIRLKGIGAGSSFVLAREFFGWRQFRNRREVAALAGLAPTPYQTAESARERGISESGSARLRTTAIELAWLWVRWQPQSPLTLWFHRRFAGGSRRQRKIGIVATARKLLIELWRYLETGEVPKGAIVA